LISLYFADEENILEYFKDDRKKASLHNTLSYVRTLLSP